MDVLVHLEDHMILLQFAQSVDDIARSSFPFRFLLLLLLLFLTEAWLFGVQAILVVGLLLLLQFAQSIHDIVLFFDRLMLVLPVTWLPALPLVLVVVVVVVGLLLLQFVQ